MCVVENGVRSIVELFGCPHVGLHMKFEELTLYANEWSRHIKTEL